jgi:hypothetical protein
MTEDEFKFNNGVDMNALAKQIGESMAGSIGVSKDKIKCKGIRFFFVEEDSEMLMSSGLFVKDFSPEDWDDDE